MAKQVKLITYGLEARNKLKAGVEKLARAVVTTLGPRGRNVAIDRPWGQVDVLHDGVSVAKEVFLEDPFENMGAQLVKQASSKTNDQAGDGTTTATLLAWKITEYGMQAIDEGSNPMFLKKGIDKATSAVIEQLKKISKPIEKEDWLKVATISAQSSEIGEKIAKALELVGEDGLVEVAESQSISGLEIEHTEGMEIDKGYLSRYFLTNPETLDAELEKPFILITDAKLSSPDPLINILKKASGAGRPLLIIADNIDGNALNVLVINKLKGTLSVCAIQAPSFGESREDVLEDIAIVTGGTVVSQVKGFKLEEVELEQCGMAERVVVKENSTRIINGDGTKEEVEARVKQLKGLEEKETNEFKKTRINERIAMLTKGVAIIRVSAATEVELNDKKERVKDAVGATKAAVEEGIIPGGGIALIQALKVLDDLKCETPDEERGIDIVRSALLEPTKNLIRNCGKDPDKILAKILGQNDENFGFNAVNLKLENLVEAGVIDPVKVTRLALENGASVASMILTTECEITDREKPQTES